ncbi:MAG TPA: cyclic nucleotide-binding domain-containing protein [Candidatus Binataceae bacterium]|nr:cyclic nucleotide-binding domain-containing protein [Candidatus Binataceae bacterium]
MRRHPKLGSGFLFHAGDPGDALFIVANCKVNVMSAADGNPRDGHVAGEKLAELSDGQAFGEMALLSGEARIATIQAAAHTDPLEIVREDFEHLAAKDHKLATAMERLSHERAIKNFSPMEAIRREGPELQPANLGHLSRSETDRLLVETGSGARLAIVLGNTLDTLPGCLVSGAKFAGFATLSITLIRGMFVGGIPEAAAERLDVEKRRATSRSESSLYSRTSWSPDLSLRSRARFRRLGIAYRDFLSGGRWSGARPGRTCANSGIDP